MSVTCWHDLECGSYREDLGLWLRLAVEHRGPVLDVGAGTGRVSLPLAAAGHAVVALDQDDQLLAELARRAGAGAVRTVRADARDFALPESFPLIIVPMQTVQLLGGGGQRRRFLGCARRHLRPGGRLAIALAEELEAFSPPPHAPLPAPDVCQRGGTRYVSQPTAILAADGAYVLERRREIQRSETAEVSYDRVRLDELDAGALESEAQAAGFDPAAREHVAATDAYAGSTVVMLDG